MSGYRVREGQILHREAQAAELGAQILEPLQLVPVMSRALELHLRAQALHLHSQHVERAIIGAVEKRARQTDALVVFRRRAPPNAGAETLGDLVADAARGARQLKQLLLIAEEHLEVGAAVTQHRYVVELAHRLSQPLRADERPVIGRHVLAGWTSYDDQLRGRTRRELDERIVPRIAHHRDVVTRPESLDQLELAQQRGELARRVLPLDLFRRPENARALVLGVRAPEITEQARAHSLGLPDVQHLAVARQHPVDAGTVGGAVTYRHSHHGELSVRRRSMLEARRAADHLRSDT
jgi:hypothetical protein